MNYRVIRAESQPKILVRNFSQFPPRNEDGTFALRDPLGYVPKSGIVWKDLKDENVEEIKKKKDFR